MTSSPVEVLRFFAHGRPQPQGSKRVFNRRGGGPPVMVEAGGSLHASWRREVKAAAFEAAALAGLAEPITGPVSVRLTFCFDRNIGDYGSGRNGQAVKASAPDYPTKPPDVDKLVRAVFDAITDAKVWVDDAQVVSVTAHKRLVDRFDRTTAPGVDVVIGVLP